MTQSPFFNRVVPAMFDGYFLNWTSTLETLAGMPAEVFVPGHGAIGARSDLEIAKGFLELLMAQVKEAHAAGRGEEEIAKPATPFVRPGPIKGKAWLRY